MKKKKGIVVNVAVWIFLVILASNGSIFSNIFSIFSDSNTSVTEDTAMETTSYNVDIEVGEDSSYAVTENIGVDFQTFRHGIYRYIPYTGSSRYVDKHGESEAIPYKAEITDIGSSETGKVEKKNGNIVMRIGDENNTVYGDAYYELHYTFTPTFQKKGYDNIYYNIYPAQWQNDIPEGSSFKVTFPKEIDASKIEFYYGPYGSTDDGNNLVSWNMEGNVLTGVLTQDLPYANGLTLYANVGAGYFTEMHTLSAAPWLVMLAVSLLTLAVMALMYYLFGKDEELIPSIQYQPPDGLDSAAVGYIVDGVVESRDIISLIIYWADKGYLSINETAKNKISFDRLSHLPAKAPEYQKQVFNEMFASGDHVTLSSLKYKFSYTIDTAQTTLKNEFNKSKDIYTRSSKIARVMAVVLCGMPFIGFLMILNNSSGVIKSRMIMQVLVVIFLYVGVVIFCRAIDTWYGRSSKGRRGMVAAGIGISFASIVFYAGVYISDVVQGRTFNFIPAFIVVLLATLGCVMLTGFMRKRTDKCIEWMGKLVGLRDFIETAELERMEVLAKDDPQFFYHIIPYAYVFGISEVFAKKLQALTLEPPQWYHSYRPFGNGYFNFYVFNSCLMNNMAHISDTLTVSESSSGGSDGGFSGGGFGGGGFSGGGFGGGGGGSW